MGAGLAETLHRLVPVTQRFAQQQDAHRPHARRTDPRIGERDPEIRAALGQMIVDRQLHERPDRRGGLLAGRVGLGERRVQRYHRDKDTDQREDGLPEGEPDEGALGAGTIGRGGRRLVVVAGRRF